MKADPRKNCTTRVQLDISGNSAISQRIATFVSYAAFSVACFLGSYYLYVVTRLRGQQVLLSVVCTVALLYVVRGRSRAVEEVVGIRGDVVAALCGCASICTGKQTPEETMCSLVQFFHVATCYVQSYGILSVTAAIGSITIATDMYELCRDLWEETLPPAGFLQEVGLRFVFCQFFVVGGHLGAHRYFSHKSFATSRCVQLVIACISALSLGRGSLWWVSYHRRHHRLCEADGDPHSPRDGFLYSHIGWILDRGKFSLDFATARDFVRYPELLIVDILVPCYTTLCMNKFCKLLDLDSNCWTSGLGWALHLIYCTNSVCHGTGRDSAAGTASPAPQLSSESTNVDIADPAAVRATCDGKDVFWVGMLNGGEGFHGNHHDNPRCARHGGRYDPDLVYFVICALERCGLVWDVQHPVSTRDAASNGRHKIS